MLISVYQLEKVGPATNFTSRSTIRVMSLWARWRLKSPASHVFIQQLIQAQIKGNIKAPRHWPLRAVTGEFPAQMANNAEMFSFDDVNMTVKLPGIYKHKFPPKHNEPGMRKSSENRLILLFQIHGSTTTSLFLPTALFSQEIFAIIPESLRTHAVSGNCTQHALPRTICNPAI